MKDETDVIIFRIFTSHSKIFTLGFAVLTVKHANYLFLYIHDFVIITQVRKRSGTFRVSSGSVVVTVERVAVRV